MTAHTIPSPSYDMTIRVGCSLAYEVTSSAMLLLNVKPMADRNHTVISQALSLGDNLENESFTDSHGNTVLKVRLLRGTNVFRHDAIVAITSQPDNHHLTLAAKVDEPGDIPFDYLRYTLPSRYCDSDKLANFAWQTFGQVPHGLA